MALCKPLSLPAKQMALAGDSCRDSTRVAGDTVPVFDGLTGQVRAAKICDACAGLRCLFQNPPLVRFPLPPPGDRFDNGRRRVRQRMGDKRAGGRLWRRPGFPRIAWVRASIASPRVQPSPNGRRVGIRIVTFEACSGFTRVTARRIAQSPKATFVTRLQPFRLPGRTARQLPDQSTTLWVESSSTGDSRLRGPRPRRTSAKKWREEELHALCIFGAGDRRGGNYTLP
jgi:hypothetical protein